MWQNPNPRVCGLKSKHAGTLRLCDEERDSDWKPTIDSSFNNNTLKV